MVKIRNKKKKEIKFNKNLIKIFLYFKKKFNSFYKKNIYIRMTTSQKNTNCFGNNNSIQCENIGNYEQSRTSIEIDGNEEIEYIVNCSDVKRFTKKNINKIINLYYIYIEENDDNIEEKKIINNIVKQTSFSHNFIELVLNYQLEFLIEKGVANYS